MDTFGKSLAKSKWTVRDFSSHKGWSMLTARSRRTLIS